MEQIKGQISIFDGKERFKIRKPIRLIELFAGYGSQHLAFNYLGQKIESYKICEWAVKSIQAYKDLHFENDTKDYSAALTTEEVISYLAKKGISANYNEPMKIEQVRRLGEGKCRQIYNNIQATHNLVNITQVHANDLNIVDTDKYDYVMTYSFPCQDLSNAGLLKGMEKGNGTRSGLLWEVERILDEINITNGELPQILIMENVPGVVGTKNIKQFNQWTKSLEQLGYKNYYDILNAKDYGIPQNRRRCFMVSILGDYLYDMPKTIELKLKLKDLLEDNVEEKYFLSDQMISCFTSDETGKYNRKERFIQQLKVTNDKNIAGTIKTTAGRRSEDNFILENAKTKDLEKYFISDKMIKYIANDNEKWTGNNGESLINKTIASTLNTSEDSRRCDASNYIGYNLPENYNLKAYLPIRNATKKGYLEAYEGDGVDLEKRKGRRGTVQKGVSQTIKTQDTIGVVIRDTSLDTRCDCLGVCVNVESKNRALNETAKNIKDIEESQILDCYNRKIVKNMANNIQTGIDSRNNTFLAIKGNAQSLRIRKLTPRECWRLMGVKDEDYEKVAKNQSNASLYHLAGDSIITNVLMAIFKEML